MSRLRLLLALESRRVLSLRLVLLLLSRRAGRLDSLNPVTTVMYHLRETVMMGEKKQKSGGTFLETHSMGSPTPEA